MNQDELASRVLSALESLGIRYFVTGSVASTFYGEPRFTRDVDVVVAMSPGDVAGFLAWFPHPPYYVDEPAARAATLHRTMFNIIHPTAGKADLHMLERTEHQLVSLERARRVVLAPGTSAVVSAPEDVILNKLRYYRASGHERHLRDIHSMIAAGHTSLDTAYIARWAVELGVEDLWEGFRLLAEGGSPGPTSP